MLPPPVMVGYGRSVQPLCLNALNSLTVPASGRPQIRYEGEQLQNIRSDPNVWILNVAVGS